jgi:hypothetical protein
VSVNCGNAEPKLACRFSLSKSRNGTRNFVETISNLSGSIAPALEPVEALLGDLEIGTMLNAIPEIDGEYQARSNRC